ncbi:lysine 5,6-aminomutase subunit alpha TIM-barrel domain-containing protein [Thermosipho atlanticus]|uniref:lysine 5,6-aminomutase subunit alpha TIM-barrel domain-containing protein n=1 Tax=Thermosipho atlanticus TaxID=238991 RepID=UPI00093412AA|nr:lysine 5,6-aminomutase subunit alpha [Thermosipho atlanticus]
MLTKTIHTPFMFDRYLAIKTAKYIFKHTRNLGDEILFKNYSKKSKTKNTRKKLLKMTCLKL